MKTRFYTAGSTPASMAVGVLLLLSSFSGVAASLTEQERTAQVGKPLSLTLNLAEPNSLKFSQLSGHCLQANLVESAGQQRPLSLSFRRIGEGLGQVLIKDSTSVRDSLLQVVISSRCPLVTFSKTIPIIPKTTRVVSPAIETPPVVDDADLVSRFESNRSIQLARTFVRPSGDSSLSIQRERNDSSVVNSASNQQESDLDLVVEKGVALEDLERASEAGLLVKAEMPEDKSNMSSTSVDLPVTSLEKTNRPIVDSADNFLAETAFLNSYQKWLIGLIFIMVVTLYTMRRLRREKKGSKGLQAEDRKEPNLMEIGKCDSGTTQTNWDGGGEGLISASLLQSTQGDFLSDPTSENDLHSETNGGYDDEHFEQTNSSDTLIKNLSKAVVEMPIEHWQLPKEVLETLSIDRTLQNTNDTEIRRVRALLSLIELAFRKAQIRLTLAESEVKYLIQLGSGFNEAPETLALPIIDDFVKCRELELSNDEEARLFLSNIESVADLCPEGVLGCSSSEWRALTKRTEFSGG